MLFTANLKSQFLIADTVRSAAIKIPLQVKNSDEDHAEQVDEDKVNGDDDPTCLLARVGCFRTGGAKLIKSDLTGAIYAHVTHNNNGEESGQRANSPE